MMSASPQEGNGDTVESGATPLELFFDLIFVFAFTQVTGILSDHLTWSGMLQGAALLAALWWASYRALRAWCPRHEGDRRQRLEYRSKYLEEWSPTHKESKLEASAPWAEEIRSSEPRWLVGSQTPGLITSPPSSSGPLLPPPSCHTSAPKSKWARSRSSRFPSQRCPPRHVFDRVAARESVTQVPGVRSSHAPARCELRSNRRQNASHTQNRRLRRFSSMAFPLI
jgi:Bacterial low temperature requirement A protein (LtrA)